MNQLQPFAVWSLIAEGMKKLEYLFVQRALKESQVREYDQVDQVSLWLFALQVPSNWSLSLPAGLQSSWSRLDKKKHCSFPSQTLLNQQIKQKVKRLSIKV